MTRIKHIIMIFGALIMCALTACSDEKDEYSELPAKIQSFVSEYFPETSVSDYSFTGNIYHVTLSESAYLEFNSVPAWTLIDGRGAVLPSMLIYDQLPSALYTYLETIDTTGSVYSLKRTKDTLTVGLLDSSVVYDIASGKVLGAE